MVQSKFLFKIQPNYGFSEHLCDLFIRDSTIVYAGQAVTLLQKSLQEMVKIASGGSIMYADGRIIIVDNIIQKSNE